MACCTFSLSNAQPRQIIFDKYTIDNGLSNNNCTSIAQDEDGFIWIATSNGINRFDGKDFIKYYSLDLDKQLPSNNINKILSLKHGFLAVGTSEGLAILNTKSGVSKRLTIPASSEMQGFVNDIQDLIIDHDRNLIVATSIGVYVFDEAFRLIYRFDAFSPGDYGKKRLNFTTGSSLFLLPDGRVLIFNLNKDIYESPGFIYELDIKQKTFRNIKDIKDSEFDLLKPWNGQGFSVVGGNKRGQIILLRYYASVDSVYIIDIKKKRSVSSALDFSVAQKISPSSIIKVFDNNSFGISFLEEGVCYMHFDSTTLKCDKGITVFAEDHCFDLLVDKDNRYWSATESGIYKESIRKSFFHNVFPPSYNTGGTKIKNVVGFTKYNGEYYISQFFRGVLNYDNNLNLKQIIHLDKKGKWGFGPWNIYNYRDDTLMLACINGATLLNIRNSSERKFSQSGMPACIDSNMVTSCLHDSHHQIWFGLNASNGVFMVNTITNEWSHYSTKSPSQNFKLRFPIAIVEDSKGDIWMAGKEGITRYNNQKRIFDTLVTNLEGIGSITGRWNSFGLDKQDNFWEAWKTNLVHWNTKTGIIKIYPMPGNPALESNYIKGPWMNKIWMATQGGLVIFDIQYEKFSVLRKSDGLYGDEVRNMANLYFDSSTKRIFAGFNNAFTWFYPDEVLKDKSPISTFILSVRKPGDSTYFSGDSAYSLNYGDNSIEIRYTGINYDDGENNTYAYRLYENEPAPFVNVGPQKTVTFANLKPGYYHFQVKTILMGGIEGQVASTLYIKILPPFYQTWWFYLLCFAAVASALYAFYRYRIGQIMKLQKIRNSIASDLHDDIGSTLSSISIMSELAKKESPGSMTLLDSIGESASLMQENMRDLVWAVNPQNDRFGNILQRMHQFGSEILEAKGISFQFQYNESISTEKLSMDQRKKIYLFFKEAINNAAKYSQADQVNADLQIRNGIVTLSIADNGIGFNASQENHGNGLSNFNRRALELGGNATIHSEINRGTRIQLSFKIM